MSPLSVSFFFAPQELIRKGIPHHFRAIVWQLLGNATDMPVKNQYSELLKMSSPCEKLIRRDIARTYPEHEFFKGQDSLGQEVLFNVMKVSTADLERHLKLSSQSKCVGNTVTEGVLRFLELISLDIFKVRMMQTNNVV